MRLEPRVVEPGVIAVLSDPGKGRYFVAESGGEIVGQVMITFEWSDWRNGNLWWLQSVYVRDDARGHGVFRALFHHLEKEARAEQNVAGLRLYMYDTNSRARQSYERIGMKPTHYQVFEKEIQLHET